jgi:hypothetical protein
VLDPLIAVGGLPNLAAWRTHGSSRPLRSTVPPRSFPAWSTFLTGLGPGRHGLFDFTQKAPGAYRLAFANASDPEVHHYRPKHDANSPRQAPRGERRAVRRAPECKAPRSGLVCAREGNEAPLSISPREEVYAGPCTNRAFDVVVELALGAGYGLALVQTPWSNRKLESVRTLESVEFSAGRGMNGTHRPLGTWIATGAGAHDLDETPEPSLQDVAPTLMRAMGVNGDGDLDGSARFSERVAYAADEEAIIAERSRNLGYLE